MDRRVLIAGGVAALVAAALAALILFPGPHRRRASTPDATSPSDLARRTAATAQREEPAAASTPSDASTKVPASSVAPPAVPVPPATAPGDHSKLAVPATSGRGPGTRPAVGPKAGGPGEDAPYNGPKASITVRRFDNKTRRDKRLGRGLAAVFATELRRTNRFVVIERVELGAVLQRQPPGPVLRPKKTMPAVPEPVELLVCACVTRFELGGKDGARRGRGRPDARDGQPAHARIEVDLLIIDARTSRIVAATSIAGRAEAPRREAARPPADEAAPLDPALAPYGNTPMGTAIRSCIANCARFVATRVPAQYFRFDATGRPVQQAPDTDF